MNTQVVVIAKEPVPGLVKTRLCPPYTARQAATLAAAALADTMDTISATRADRRVLLLAGGLAAPPGWHIVPQRGESLGERLANGFADTAAPGWSTVLIGMDTPQATVQLLQQAVTGLSHADAVLGLAEDGGWWLLALRDPLLALFLAGVPMSLPDTGELTHKALAAQGLTVMLAPVLRDVDTFADLEYVAAQCHPQSRFASAMRDLP